ncbi:MAG TPA: hypothetical protein VFE24_18305 [Pirellulales bacterium]|jgi:hypothetical protein|nr:hypothetical protein [Pirellulales bacterium]
MTTAVSTKEGVKTAASADTPGNRQKIAQLEAAWAVLLRDTLQRGFYGTVRIELAVQDGTIQHVRRTVEQVDR